MGYLPVVDLPVTPPLAPMLGRLVRDLPPAGGYLFEPKWDGFRCLGFRCGDEVDLRSRHDRPLARYFPEIVDALRTLPERRLVVDGELLVIRDGGLDFAALMSRLHPAPSRVARLAAETPARYVGFDLLGCADRDLRAEPFGARRRELEAALRDSPGPLTVTPITADAGLAREWLARGLPGGVADGVIAKHHESTYQPGKRAFLKIKRERTADCVVAGLRLIAADVPQVSSLLLGVYDDVPALRHVGVTSAFPAAERRALLHRLGSFAIPLDEHPWARGFAVEGGPTGRLKGSAGRWTPDMTLDWVPLRPLLVCEVAYDALDGLRFRHPARFRRWRPDRDPHSCDVGQFDTVGTA